MLTSLGLSVQTHHEHFPVAIPTARHFAMVRAQYMSLLQRFSDDELTAGIDEIRHAHPEEILTFPDRYTNLVSSTPGGAGYCGNHK